MALCSLGPRSLCTCITLQLFLFRLVIVLTYCKKVLGEWLYNFGSLRGAATRSGETFEADVTMKCAFKGNLLDGTGRTAFGYGSGWVADCIEKGRRCSHGDSHGGIIHEKCPL